MSSIKRLKTILSAASFSLLILLSFNVYYNCRKQYKVIINTYLDMEATIIKEAAKISKLWFDKRIHRNINIDEIEQEIFTEFIDPIRLLKNGDAWIYNKNYVIFDKSSDFPGYIQREINERNI